MLDICFLLVVAVFVTILSVILLVHSSVCCISKSPIRFNSAYGQRGILLVTAHPDDECMFFAPTILMLQQLIDAEIHLLCLSSGDFYSQGKVREKELQNSCKALGIDNCSLINDETLPDNPNVQWNPEIISTYVNEIIRKENIQVVITFDESGVSKHPNHIAIYKAIRKMVESKEIKSVPCRYSSVRAGDDKSIKEIHWNSRSASQYFHISNLSRPQFFTCDAGSESHAMSLEPICLVQKIVCNFLSVHDNEHFETY